MKLSKEDRKAIAESHKISSVIGRKLKETSEGVKDKVDLTNLAKSLSTRRERILKEEEKKEE